VRKNIPILSIVTWLGGILTIIRGPFSDLSWFSPPEIVPCLALGAFAGLMGRYAPILLIYQVCGIALAVIAGIGGFRWARLASLALAVPAALWGLLGLFALLGWSFHRDDPRPYAPVFLWIMSYIVVLLLICMPVFWALLCYKWSERGLISR